MSYEEKVEQIGYKIQPVNLEIGKFVQGLQVGNLIFTSDQIPSWEGKEVKGKVGKEVTLEEGYQAAKMSAVNNLRVIKIVAGSLDEVVRIVKVFGIVNVAPSFDNTPAVINGCSDLLREVFGDAGKHAPSVVGMTILLNWAVECVPILFYALFVSKRKKSSSFHNNMGSAEL
jgi:enamine deaminase RidA (YjgF/YER057c/UK114 family)